jgi:hypothetical protein
MILFLSLEKHMTPSQNLNAMNFINQYFNCHFSFIRKYKNGSRIGLLFEPLYANGCQTINPTPKIDGFYREQQSVLWCQG